MTRDEWEIEYVKRAEERGGPAESLAREILEERKKAILVEAEVHQTCDIPVIVATMVNSLMIIGLWIVVLILR